MKSLSTYKLELTEIAARLGYSGIVVDMITSLLAYSIHENDFNNMIRANEMDPDKSTRINNIIDFAISRMYSIYRGTNPKILLTIRADLYQQLTKHQLIWSGKGFNVYNLTEVNLSKDQEYTIECIVATSMESIESTSEMRHPFFIDFSTKDVSEDVSLYQSIASDWEEMEFSKVMMDLTDKNLNP